MNFSKINYQQVQQLAEQLKSASLNMENILNDVTVLLNQIGNADVWNGTSAEAARAKFNTLSAKFPEFYNATSKCHSHLLSVVENYKNVDISVSSN